MKHLWTSIILRSATRLTHRQRSSRLLRPHSRYRRLVRRRPYHRSILAPTLAPIRVTRVRIHRSFHKSVSDRLARSSTPVPVQTVSRDRVPLKRPLIYSFHVTLLNKVPNKVPNKVLNKVPNKVSNKVFNKMVNVIISMVLSLVLSMVLSMVFG
nr:MAG: hypothetical protein [Apis mellifera filamentous virus]